jgi:hypothetical protein
MKSWTWLEKKTQKSIDIMTCISEEHAWVKIEFQEKPLIGKPSCNSTSEMMKIERMAQDQISNGQWKMVSPTSREKDLKSLWKIEVKKDRECMLSSEILELLSLLSLLQPLLLHQ